MSPSVPPMPEEPPRSAAQPCFPLAVQASPTQQPHQATQQPLAEPIPAAVLSTSSSLMRPVAIGWATAPALILLSAALLTVGENRQVIVPWWNLVLPETCGMYARFGLDCPGCGLTRSFIHLAHADPVAAWRLNPLSWLLFGYVAAQIPLALGHLMVGRSRWIQRLTRLNEWSLILLMSGLTLRWIWKLCLGELG